MSMKYLGINCALLFAAHSGDSDKLWQIPLHLNIHTYTYTHYCPAVWHDIIVKQR